MSKIVERRQMGHVESDLEEKMVLLAGPRQCGKTTLARHTQNRFGGRTYNWDITADRTRLRQSNLDESAHLWIFDEIHKNRHWRNWLKGIFDLHHDRHRILVTGSARLDVYARGGDSLQGRYFKHRLHPITLSELCGFKVGSLDDFPRALRDATDSTAAHQAFNNLMTFGGFPEPLVSSSLVHAKRWRLAYGELLVREDIRTLETIRDLDRMELLFGRLPDGVGSVLSINALREDLEVAFETVKHWLGVFENTYAIFRVAPYGPPRIKAVKKEQKLYFWDWARIEQRSARFENLIAMHLLRFVHWAEDVFGEKTELRYFRTVVGHEVDFVVIKNKQPWFAVECKEGNRQIDSNLKYLLERVRMPFAFQVTADTHPHRRLPDINGCEIHCMPASQFLTALP